MTVIYMIEQYYDTDCLSSFLWVNRQDILKSLFKNNLHLPKKVYNELMNPSVPKLNKLTKKIINEKIFILEKDIMVNSKEYSYYYEMTQKPDKGIKVIGGGEAAALSHAIVNKSVIASNNLKDITYYVKKYKVNYITTGDILKKALEQNYITEKEGNNIWKNMIKRKRKLPTKSFTDYLQK